MTETDAWSNSLPDDLKLKMKGLEEEVQTLIDQTHVIPIVDGYRFKSPPQINVEATLRSIIGHDRCTTKQKNKATKLLGKVASLDKKINFKQNQKRLHKDRLTIELGDPTGIQLDYMENEYDEYY